MITIRFFPDSQEFEVVDSTGFMYHTRNVGGAYTFAKALQKKDGGEIHVAPSAKFPISKFLKEQKDA